MGTRRAFIQQSMASGILMALPDSFSFFLQEDAEYAYHSDYLKIRLLKNKPAFSFFSTDSLGKREFADSPLFGVNKDTTKNYSCQTGQTKISWSLNDFPVWACKLKPKVMQFRSRWGEGGQVDPFEMIFSQKRNHCTVLGIMAGDKAVQFPCLLHFPGMGTFRISCNDPDVALGYDAELTKEPYVKVALPGADPAHTDIRYTFEAVAIYPDIDQIADDARFDGFKKNYINIFQLNPRRKILANNSTSDACAFTLFLYAEMACKTPALTSGFTAMDLIRNTLDAYLGGTLGYGMVGKPNWQSIYNSSDSFPSLVMAAAYYILETDDWQWAAAHYDGIAGWAREMIATDTNNDGIIEYGYSGNSGSWTDEAFKRPANWWDTIGFGHDDAYANALAYRSCVLLAKVADRLQKENDATYFSGFASKLKGSYFDRFYHPETGVLGGWRSADGVLHDYYFTFVNAIAICYDLVDAEQGKQIMTRMLDKMKEVGYTDFRLGLPGNLIPIADEDYAHHVGRWGYQQFQVYENGGATGCYVYYTIHALFTLGMRTEAEEILFAMLESYKDGSFSGNCPESSMTKDWKTWDGACWGYEGFLVDNYLALLNVLDYFNM